MSLTVITDASLSQVKWQLLRLLSEGINNPDVRRAALSASAGIPDDPLTAIFEWLKAHTRYVHDPVDRELFISPAKMLERIRDTGIAEGDCDDLALLSASMLGSIGYTVRLALLDTDFDGELNHALTQVFSEKLGMWLNVDLSSPYPIGWEIRYGKAEYIAGGD